MDTKETTTKEEAKITTEIAGTRPSGGVEQLPPRPIHCQRTLAYLGAGGGGRYFRVSGLVLSLALGYGPYSFLFFVW